MSKELPATLEQGGLRLKRTAVTLSGLGLLQLSFQALGIIYSDIGTSPLYVLNGIWPSSGEVPSKEDIIGGVSAILWSLTLIPLIKYVFIGVNFGTQEGEGGTFALFQGLYPPEDIDFDADRTLTGDSCNELSSSSSQPSRMKQRLRWPLLVWCLFGTALTMSDGIFTPAVSVTSAVGGIAVAKASISDNIVPISIAIIIVLFLAQQFGTSKIAFTFAPISFIWMLLLLATGIYNITSYPGIFRAVDPSRAILLFVRTKDYDLLSGILLAITGCEAIFANLGQFNKLSIQLSFSCIVYPSLCMAYLGQGARLIVDGAVIENIFYQTIPGPINGPLWWIVFVFSILATVIASQALISATFNLVQQLVNMKALPPLRMHFTSDTIQGQVYIGAVNWILMVVIIIVIAVFKDLTAMTNAYGFAVATVMLSTAILLSVQMIYVKQWPVVVAVLFFFSFGFIDALFWGASLKKVPHGAWVPLMIGSLLCLLMFFWTWARGLEDRFDGANRYNLRHFIYSESKPAHHTATSEVVTEDDVSIDEDLESVSYYFLPSNHPDGEDPAGDRLEKKRELTRIPTCAVFHKLTPGRGVPHSFVGFIRQWPALPQVLIFLSVAIVPIARVAAEERYKVTKVRSIDGFYGVTYNIGFRDKFDVETTEIIEKLCELEKTMNPTSAVRTIQIIRDVAAASNATHIVPHYHVVSKMVGAGKFSIFVSWMRKFLIESVYRRLSTIFPDTANWLTSADEIIRVGINANI